MFVSLLACHSASACKISS